MNLIIYEAKKRPLRSLRDKNITSAAIFCIIIVPFVMKDLNHFVIRCLLKK